MPWKKTSLSFFLILWCVSPYAQFVIGVNKTTGAIYRITNPSDKYGMNWIFASGDSNLIWQKPEQDWGLGKYDAVELGLKDERWTTIAEQKTPGNKSSLVCALNIRFANIEAFVYGKLLY